MSKKRSENDPLGTTFKSQALNSNLSNNLTRENSLKPLKGAPVLPSTMQKKKSNARGQVVKIKGGPTTRTRPNAKTILGYTSEDEDPPNYLDVMSYD